MNKTILFNFEVDKENRRIHVERSFDAPLDLVWTAWTDPEILDLWWAPKPFRAETKSMNFTEGGRWLYCMVSPEGERHWSLFEYHKINLMKSYSGLDAFCNEAGVINDQHPRMRWHNTFAQHDDKTVVNVEITFDKLDDLEAVITMGFKEGFTMGLQNLDEYIKAQFYLRKRNKPNNQARVSIYVNFPGTTEEAMNFYRSVFKTEFINGIQRFGDIPAGTDQPPLSESVKKLVLHVELPLLGGHVLMATDSTKEMGFTVTSGNNMHIMVEPDSRNETERIFKELSAGGSITQPLQDMFWGSYYGSFTDRYGINWMLNYQPR